jgi:hypothetical protein
LNRIKQNFGVVVAGSASVVAGADTSDANRGVDPLAMTLANTKVQNSVTVLTLLLTHVL